MSLLATAGVIKIILVSTAWGRVEWEGNKLIDKMIGNKPLTCEKFLKRRKP